jgi:hypothetical protein
MNRFVLWKIFRSWVVLALFLIALLSILFSGALDVHDLSETSAVHEVKAAVVKNLFFASFVMAMHAIYLGLMLYHLIFRHPVELKRAWEGFLFFVIVLGYLFHAIHDYVEGLEGFEPPLVWRILSPTVFFTGAYFGMGLLGWLEEPKHKHARPALHARETWMLGTDTGMFFLLLFLSYLEISHSSIQLPQIVRPRLDPIAQAWQYELSYRQLPQTVSHFLQRPAPKDWAILAALLCYVCVRLALRRHLKLKHQDFRREMLEHHKLDEKAELSELNHYLEGKLRAKSVWLDFKCEYGIHFRELIELLHLKPEIMQEIKVIVPSDSDPSACIFDKLPAGNVTMTVERRPFPKTSNRSAIAAMLRDIDLIHVANAAYTPSSARRLLHYLSQARKGVILLLRYTSGASYYRAVSSSMSCAPMRPYIHHWIHPLLIKDLRKGDEWSEFSPPSTGPLAPADGGFRIRCHLKDLETDKTRQDVVNWVESQYGEFSGDVLQRYTTAFAAAGEEQLLHSDVLHVFEKK